MIGAMRGVDAQLGASRELPASLHANLAESIAGLEEATRWLVETYPIGEVLFSRSLVALTTMAIFILPTTGLIVFRTQRLTAHGMPLHPRRALCCAEHLLGSRCRLFMRLPHSSVDHGFGYTAQSHALNVGKVIGVHNVAVSPLNETTAPENGAPG